MLRGGKCIKLLQPRGCSEKQLLFSFRSIAEWVLYVESSGKVADEEWGDSIRSMYGQESEIGRSSSPCGTPLCGHFNKKAKQRGAIKIDFIGIVRN